MKIHVQFRKVCKYSNKITTEMRIRHTFDPYFHFSSFLVFQNQLTGLTVGFAGINWLQRNWALAIECRRSHKYEANPFSRFWFRRLWFSLPWRHISSGLLGSSHNWTCKGIWTNIIYVKNSKWNVSKRQMIPCFWEKLDKGGVIWNENLW